MDMRKYFFLAVILALSLLVSSCTTNPGAQNDTSSVASEPEQTGVFGKPTPSRLDINSGDFKKASEVDANYITKTENGYTYLSIFAPEINISGFPYLQENGNQLYRLKLADKDKYSANNSYLAWDTAGGHVRFRTNATSLKIDVTLQYSGAGMKHFAPSGISGIDVYVGTGTARQYVTTVLPKQEPNYSGDVTLEAGTKEVLINLPSYAGIKEMSIGFPEGTTVAQPLPYTYEKPIVFYGSSITQGGCSSRPGTAYFNILSRALDANIVNLGFSGSAFGETSIAEYIASIELSAFVFDYDYNADTPEKLGPTHYPFYEIVRKAHPDIPIIFVSRCSYNPKDPNAVQCRKLIMDNYEKAKAAGDNNVYFVDGSLFFDQDNPNDYTVDGLHPTDLGFRAMAEVIYPVLKAALEK